MKEPWRGFPFFVNIGGILLAEWEKLRKFTMF